MPRARAILRKLGGIKVGQIPLGVLSRFAAVLLAAVVILGVPTMVLANQGIQDAFSSAYPSSTSDTNAGCALCHGPTTATLNAYGAALRGVIDPLTGLPNFAAVEGTNSDGDPSGSTNLQEINANTQPGWTAGPNNTLYDRRTGAVVATNQNPPTSITGSLDPVTAQPNISVSPASLAFGNVTIGQTKSLDVTVSNTGTANLVVSSLGITGAEFSTSKAVPFTVNPGASTTVPVTYAPANAGLDNGNLAIGSNDPDTATLNVGLSGTGVTQTQVTDLDIARFKATGQVRLKAFHAIRLKLAVVNNGEVDLPDGTATIVGMQGGVIVYQAQIEHVTARLREDGIVGGDDRVTFRLALGDRVRPSQDPDDGTHDQGDDRSTYKVTITDPSAFQVGIVEWTVTLSTPGDVDGPDGDTATATTEIRP